MITNIPTQIPIFIPNVPFYSQFKDIKSLSWQKVGCGVTSLAMVINYYKPSSVTANDLLVRGVAAGAYDKNAGWIHRDLIALSEKYELSGKSYDVSGLTKTESFDKFKKYLNDGPVIVSIHYKFDPKSFIPHLVVIEGVDGDTLYYNDPAGVSGQKKISIVDFQKGWKKKFIVVRPMVAKSKVLSYTSST